MKQYRKKFKVYLDDLGKRKPSPGGGSAVCLVFCAGVSLMEKAINYSVKPGSQDKHCRRLKRYMHALQKIRRKTYPLIDKDAYIFERIMNSKGKARDKFIRQSESLVIGVAQACREVFFLAKEVESDIKKSILSDFVIGRAFIKSALAGCLVNLEANAGLFGKRSKHIEAFSDLLQIF
jgi:formiminotetrahydrofolate cyclodeaminase